MIGNLKIITTVFNAEKYVKKCIDSIKGQTFKNWKMLIVNDCSTDNTKDIINEETKNDERFIVVHNTENKKALQNYVEQIPILCNNDEDIIISIDGDDWLYSNDVFEYINEIYKENILVTYGQYITSADLNKNNIIKGCSRPLTDITETKKIGINLSHLKTFKYLLWKKVKNEDMKINGKYVEMAWDTAFMPPLVQMAGLKRTKYIDKILYVYNIENPISDFRVNSKLQENTDYFLRQRKMYDEL